MAAAFPIPPMKKPMTAYQPRRGRIKAQIFEGIAEAIASAASRARHLFGLIKKNGHSTPPTPPPSPRVIVNDDGGGQDEKSLVDFIILEKNP